MKIKFTKLKKTINDIQEGQSFYINSKKHVLMSPKGLPIPKGKDKYAFDIDASEVSLFAPDCPVTTKKVIEKVHLNNIPPGGSFLMKEAGSPITGVYIFIKNTGGNLTEIFNPLQGEMLVYCSSTKVTPVKSVLVVEE